MSKFPGFIWTGTDQNYKVQISGKKSFQIHLNFNSELLFSKVPNMNAVRFLTELLQGSSLSSGWCVQVLKTELSKSKTHSKITFLIRTRTKTPKFQTYAKHHFTKREKKRKQVKGAASGRSGCCCPLLVETLHSSSATQTLILGK